MQMHRRNKVKMKYKGKFKFPYFYTIYGVLMIASFIAIFIGLGALSSYLYDYEKSLPKYIAEDIFNQYYSPCDFGMIFDKANCEVSELDGRDGFIKHMESETAGKDITYREVSAGLGETKKYIIKAGENKISEFTLKKSGQKNEHGFDMWELDAIKAFYKAENDVTIKALKGSTVYVNNIPLGDEYLTSDEFTTESAKHLPAGVPGIVYVKYKVDGLLNVPQVHTLDRRGDSSVLIYDEADGLYAEQINYDDILGQQQYQYVVKAAESYAKYMTRDASLATLRTYFDSTSKIYQLIRTSETYWFTPHIGYEFKDTNVVEFYAYSDDVFSCRYLSTQFIYKSATETFRYPMNLTLYFKKINGNYMVYDLVNNG